MARRPRHPSTPSSKFLVVNGKASVIIELVGVVPADLKPALENQVRDCGSVIFSEAGSSSPKPN